MDLKKIALMVFIIVVVFILGGVLFFFVGGALLGGEEIEEVPLHFRVEEMGRAGNYGYVVYDFAGQGNVSLITFRKESPKTITVIKDDEGIEMDEFDEFVELLGPLEKYDYKIEVSDRRVLESGINIVPTGAMPTYVLDDLQNNLTDGVVVYLGKTDLTLRVGLSERQWYTELTDEQKDRILVYEKTLDEYMEEGDFRIVDDIIENRWSMVGKTTYSIEGDGRKTSTIEMEDGLFVRVVYDLGAKKGLTDSIALPPVSNVLEPEPQSKYPWEDSELRFHLETTEGQAYLSVYKDGSELKSKRLGSVAAGNVYREILDYEEAGEYILMVEDNSGTIASGVLHVKELRIDYIDSIGYTYFFSVTVDGVPLNSAEVEASINNSTEKKKFYVTNGELSIGAKLQRGENIFNVDIEGTTLKVPVIYERENILDVYINYGIPGLLLVALVYAGARITRRPTYVLKATEGTSEIRKEIRIKMHDLVAAFREVRKDIKIGKSPITAKEFEMAMKRYITKGADVTEGNIEEMLKKLVNKGILESHRQYYQFAGEGDVKENVLLRMIRENLIENGIAFRTAHNRFVTKDYEIGLFGEKFDKKAIIVVDDENEIRKIISGLSDDERAKLRIKEANGLVTFVPIDRLGMIL